MGKVAVITGASRGIGRTVAVGLAQHGYHCCLVARDDVLLGEVRAEIRASGGSATCYPMDVGNATNVRECAELIGRSTGRCDLLFNNAGLWHAGTLDVTEDDFDAMLAVNVKGPLFFMQAFATLLRRSAPSHIINVASIGAHIGFASTGAYGATKRALLGLSESVYRDFAKDGVKVTSLSPSWVDTDMARDAASPYSRRDMIQKEDVLETVRWLLRLSPAAAVKDVFIDCYGDVE